MENFRNISTSIGLLVTAPIFGKLQRVPTELHPDKKNGWYIVIEIDGGVYGTAGNWETGEQVKIVSNGADYSSSSEWKIAAKKAEQETNSRYEKAKNIAKSAVNSGKAANKSHPYLVRKKILPTGALQAGDDLLLPVFSPDGDITSYQTISPAGEKRFLFGGKKKGCCFPIGDSTLKICICEGFATGASIHEATGCMVLVAFDAGNILPVATEAAKKYPEAILTICADNDHTKEKNVGIEKGKQAAQIIGCECIWPTDIEGSDFNDMAIEIGHDAVRAAILKGKMVDIYQTPKDNGKEIEIKEIIESAPGILPDIIKYYTDTAIRPQPLLALASGLIFGSIVMGRRFRTDLDNYTSAYFMIIAKSGIGKDHPKNLIRIMLKECGLSRLERAGGYTASNTVIKSLAHQPLQLAFFEEIGMKLKEAAIKPNSSATGMFRQLLDVFSSCHSNVIGDEYADGTVPRVDKPALTLVGISTPGEFFKSISESLIEQGFVNRILPFIVESKRVAVDLKPGRANIIFPETIRAWTKEIWPHAFEFEIDEKSANPTEIPITPSAYALLNQIEVEIVAQIESLEKNRLEDLPSRNREIVIRLSLICAGLSCSKVVSDDHVRWSWRLVKYLYIKYISEIKRNISGSDFEEGKMSCLKALRAAGGAGIRPSYMAKTPPWSKFDRRTRNEIIDDLKESELAALTQFRVGKRGPAMTVLVALK